MPIVYKLRCWILSQVANWSWPLTFLVCYCLYIHTQHWANVGKEALLITTTLKKKRKTKFNQCWLKVIKGAIFIRTLPFKVGWKSVGHSGSVDKIVLGQHWCQTWTQLNSWQVQPWQGGWQSGGPAAGWYLGKCIHNKHLEVHWYKSTFKTFSRCCYPERFTEVLYSCSYLLCIIFFF